MAIKIVRAGKPVEPQQEQAPTEESPEHLAAPPVQAEGPQEAPQPSASEASTSLGPLSDVLALSAGTTASSEDLLPWELDEGYTILDALSELYDTKNKGKTLTLVSIKDPSTAYIVKSFDVSSRRAILEGGFKGGQLKPVISEREVSLYYPVWR